MKSSRRRPWHHNTLQYTLLEFARLKQTCPEGIYLSLKPGKPAQWSGVIFVRKGPYAPAILRFQVSFPPDYPTLPPAVTFTSDIFHPLVAPLTTYTYTTGSSGTETVSATDRERLAPGGFSLRHGFPHWYGRPQTSTASSEISSRDLSDIQDRSGQKLSNAIRPPPEDTSSRASSRLSHTSHQAGTPTTIGVHEVLVYMKRSFDDEEILDDLPLEVAGNSGAWKAWQAYRKSIKSIPDNTVSETATERQNEWSWDGVWEERVRKGIDASIAESTLYGNAGGGGEDLVRFGDIDDELFQEIRVAIVGSVGIP